MTPTIILGAAIYVFGIVVWNTRYIVASDHFLRANIRLSGICTLVGLLFALGSFA